MGTYDVVIIGAGISGLTAGYRLNLIDPNLKIVILEAKDRVGGRTLSVELKADKDTDIWDIGGQWVSTSQDHILALLEELNLETYPQYIEGTKFSQLGNADINAYNGIIPTISIFAALELHMLIQRVEKLGREVPIENPYLHPKARELDALTCEAFRSKYLRWKSSQDLMDAACRATFGLEPSRCSVLALSAISNSAGGYMRLFEAINQGAQELRVKGGTQQISIKMAAKLGEEAVLLNHAVTDIIQTKEKVDVIANDKIFTAKRVIVAIPVHEAAKIRYTPRMSEAHQILLNNMPMGHLTKFVITYKNAFWRERGYSGEIVSNGGMKISSDCDTGPLGIVYDATTHNNNPALLGFIAGNAGIQWSTKTPIERKINVLHCLSKFFGEEALTPIDYIEKVWSEEPYNGGCPVNIPATGVMQYIANNLRKPFGRVHWAGTDTATVWCGYLSGAVQAGHRAAKEVLYHLRPDCLTSEDLQDTAYTRNMYRYQRVPNKNYFKKMTLGLSLCLILIIVARKAYFRMVI